MQVEIISTRRQSRHRLSGIIIRPHANDYNFESSLSGSLISILLEWKLRDELTINLNAHPV